MADEKQLKQAKTVYDTLCATLDEQKWHYNKHDDDFTISCEVTGEDIPISIRVIVSPEIQLVTVLSNFSFAVPEDKRVDAAIALSVINYSLVDGSFDYNIKTGSIVYRLTSSYRESLISKEAILYMVFCSCGTVDDYNDKLMMLCKGHVTLEKFIEMLKD